MKKTLRTITMIFLAVLLSILSIILVSCNDEDDNDGNGSVSNSVSNGVSGYSGGHSMTDERNIPLTTVYELPCGGNATEYSVSENNTEDIFPDSILQNTYGKYHNALSSIEMGLIDGILRMRQDTKYSTDGRVSEMSITIPRIANTSIYKIILEWNQEKETEKIITTTDAYGNGVSSYVENKYNADKLSSAVMYSSEDLALMKITYQNGKRVVEEDYSNKYKVCYEYDASGNVASATYYKALEESSAMEESLNVEYVTEYFKKQLFVYTNGAISSIKCECVDDETKTSYTFTANYSEAAVNIFDSGNRLVFKYEISKNSNVIGCVGSSVDNGKSTKKYENRYEFDDKNNIIKVEESEYSSFERVKKETVQITYQSNKNVLNKIENVKYGSTDSIILEDETISFNDDGAVDIIVSKIYDYNGNMDLNQSSSMDMEYDSMGRLNFTSMYSYFKQTDGIIIPKLTMEMELSYVDDTFEISEYNVTTYEYTEDGEAVTTISNILTDADSNPISGEIDSYGSTGEIVQKIIIDNNGGSPLYTVYTYNSDGSCNITYPDGSTEYIPPTK
ncbi:MAG: hypothetical protein SOZ62_01200 [Eubacteriales bacterium]|nr:hypothetical protein [Eubacteriales bacterium]